MSIRFDAPLRSPSRTASQETLGENPAWCLLFLEHLDEFATLAWYLVVDHQLVEVTIQRTLAQLEMTPFDASTPLLAYVQAKEELITQAIAGLGLGRKRSEEEAEYLPNSLAELPDLPRLAFMLKLVLRSSEIEVARFLEVTPTKVRELVQVAIDRLSLRVSFSVLTGCYDA
jgi:DNA-directed RNA polymerase specialized sigma24 family protein